MTEPIRSMAGLVDALRQRRDELDISHETIDAIAGLQSGYASKLLAPRAPRNIGYMSLGDIMGALGVGLQVVEDDEQVQRVRGRWQKRKPQGPRYKAASSGPSKRIDISQISVEDDLFAVMQRRGKMGGIKSGETRAKKAKRRREIKLKRSAAARARWAKARPEARS